MSEYDPYEELRGLEECHAESVTQYRSECAMFGDAGPGQLSHIQSLAAKIAQIRAKLTPVDPINNWEDIPF